jgi:hypothetical protein
METSSILDLFNDCTFDGQLSSNDMEDKIIMRLPASFEFDWEEGASKLVIIPKDAEFVIKIPYTGEDIYINHRNEYIHHKFNCANGSYDYNWDYCFTETLLWKMAKREKVQWAFAKERMIGTINKHPIYLQQRVVSYGDSERYDSASEENRKKTIDFCEENNLFALDNDLLSWQADALQYYGGRQFNKIMSFIFKYNIEDLHAGNLGYLYGRPIIFDYSSFEN